MTEDSLQKILGENIARYRTEKGLRQAKLAELISVSTAFMSRVERSQKMMKVPTLLATSNALNVSFDAFYAKIQ